MSICDFTADCTEPAIYSIEWDQDAIGIGDTESCVGHTAEARANNPLGYIVAVRSLPKDGQR